MAKISRIRRLKMVIFGETLWYLRSANDWTHRNGRKSQHFNHYTLSYLLLYFGIFHSKSVIMLVLCLDLARIIFINFYSLFSKWMILLILRITFLYIVCGYQTRIFHSKSVILIVLYLDLTNSLFSTIFTQWFKGKLFC